MLLKAGELAERVLRTCVSGPFCYVSQGSATHDDI